MQFKSKKDTLFSSIIFGTNLLLISIIIWKLIQGKLTIDDYIPIFIITVVVSLLFWIYFGTNYELKNKTLIYKSGPIKGKIEIESIHEIIKNRTLWVGFKTATARNGLIIKYNKYDEMYISPKSNNQFIDSIKELNHTIKITE
ncbi:PH domain-containing protein [Flavobacterium jejuense]|uniref:PH domain-containing protein n=1 Tax=Flavobacterium jejuense TaxID=1544455 RepID=A0ABX0IKY7_9FLAO|nr:PH domain-containing protein [Flavobacterium jejuense]NHN24383.1 PH domain-containing protein [Flavobacterium jejuense]